jgi:hypothetical protein
MLDVKQVHLHPLLKRDFLSSLDLPKASQSRFGSAKDPAGFAVAFQFSERNHSGADETHLASQHVPELGTLVEAQLSQATAQGGDSWVVSHLGVQFEFTPEARALLENGISIRAHRAKLECIKFAIGSDNAAAIERCPAILPFDQECANCYERRQ